MFTQIADTLTALATGGCRPWVTSSFPKWPPGIWCATGASCSPTCSRGLITVAMFYNMTFLAFHKEINNMPGGATIPTIMSLGTGVVGIFAVIFLLYTNTFLMKRLSKRRSACTTSWVCPRGTSPW